MAWSVIRKATNEDVERLETTKAGFMARHDLDEIEFDMLWDDGYGESAADHEERVYLLKLWRACARRALRETGADGIAYGHVGFHVD